MRSEHFLIFQFIYIPVVYSTDRSKAVVPVLVLLFVALWFILRGDLFLSLVLCYFVLVLFFFSVLSALRLLRLGKKRANLSAFRTFVRFALDWFCLFPLPLGVLEGLRLVIVALPRLFSYPFSCLHIYFTGRLPKDSVCTFEDGLCGWTNVKDKRDSGLDWTRLKGPSPTENTGPSVDHTFGTDEGKLFCIMTLLCSCLKKGQRYFSDWLKWSNNSISQTDSMVLHV